jgi:hypothetical protein
MPGDSAVDTVPVRFLLAASGAEGDLSAVVTGTPGTAGRVFVGSAADTELEEVTVSAWMEFGADATVYAVTSAGELFLPHTAAGFADGTFAGQPVDVAAGTALGDICAVLGDGTLRLRRGASV